MTIYEVNLPEELVLEVELHDIPVHFQIRFPQGKRVKFEYQPKPHESTRVTVDKGLVREKLGEMRLRVCASEGDETGIEFTEPGSPDM